MSGAQDLGYLFVAVYCKCTYRHVRQQPSPETYVSDQVLCLYELWCIPALPLTSSKSNEKMRRQGREFNLIEIVKTKTCMDQRLHYSRARVRWEHNGALTACARKENIHKNQGEVESCSTRRTVYGKWSEASRCCSAVATVRLRRIRVDPNRIGVIHISDKEASAIHIK
jgi:hypothetical protein